MFSSILVPIDIAHRSSWEHALPKAFELAAASGASVTVLTVVRDLTLMFEAVQLPIQLERILGDARIRLAHIVAEYARERGVEQQVRSGSIVREIIAAAKERNVDLILMASHRPELRDYLIGPNAAYVAQHAPCSVLVLRKAAASDGTGN
jgi:nucleotide-binding universal stress UspA family protein